jgi:hypothetical protein
MNGFGAVERPPRVEEQRFAQMQRMGINPRGSGAPFRAPQRRGDEHLYDEEDEPEEKEEEYAEEESVGGYPSQHPRRRETGDGDDTSDEERGGGDDEVARKLSARDQKKMAKQKFFEQMNKGKKQKAKGHGGAKPVQAASSSRLFYDDSGRPMMRDQMGRYQGSGSFHPAPHPSPATTAAAPSAPAALDKKLKKKKNKNKKHTKKSKDKKKKKKKDLNTKITEAGDDSSASSSSSEGEEDDDDEASSSSEEEAEKRERAPKAAAAAAAAVPTTPSKRVPKKVRDQEELQRLRATVDKLTGAGGAAPATTPVAAAATAASAGMSHHRKKHAEHSMRAWENNVRAGFTPPETLEKIKAQIADGAMERAKEQSLQRLRDMRVAASAGGYPLGREEVSPRDSDDSEDYEREQGRVMAAAQAYSSTLKHLSGTSGRSRGKVAGAGASDSEGDDDHDEKKSARTPRGERKAVQASREMVQGSAIGLARSIYGHIIGAKPLRPAAPGMKVMASRAEAMRTSSREFMVIPDIYVPQPYFSDGVFQPDVDEAEYAERAHPRQLPKDLYTVSGSRSSMGRLSAMGARTAVSASAGSAAAAAAAGGATGVGVAGTTPAGFSGIVMSSKGGGLLNTASGPCPPPSAWPPYILPETIALYQRYSDLPSKETKVSPQALYDHFVGDNKTGGASKRRDR